MQIQREIQNMMGMENWCQVTSEIGVSYVPLPRSGLRIFLFPNPSFANNQNGKSKRDLVQLFGTSTTARSSITTEAQIENGLCALKYVHKFILWFMGSIKHLQQRMHCRTIWVSGWKLMHRWTYEPSPKIFMGTELRFSNDPKWIHSR